jgi:hypothetical protein
MKHAMLALLVYSVMVTGGLDRGFFLADDTPICLVVVGNDASFDELLTAAQIAEEIVDLAGSGCPFSLIRFEEEISREDTAKYNLIVLGENDLNLRGKPKEVAEGLFLYENPFGTKRHVLVVEDAQSLLDLLRDL